jgi:hypothetical protein
VNPLQSPNTGVGGASHGHHSDIIKYRPGSQVFDIKCSRNGKFRVERLALNYTEGHSHFYCGVGKIGRTFPTRLDAQAAVNRYVKKHNLYADHFITMGIDRVVVYVPMPVSDTPVS